MAKSKLMKCKTGGSVAKTSSQKKFAALAPPYNKATAADRIAGAKGAKPKMQKGGSASSKPSYIDQADKNLTESMGGPGAKYSMYEMQKREKANNLAEEARRQARMKYPAAASTYVKKPVGFKKGGTVTSKKKK